MFDALLVLLVLAQGLVLAHFLTKRVDELSKRKPTLMINLEELTAALDAETTAVAIRIEALLADLIYAQNNNQAPKPETLAALTAISARLKVLGANPADPIPSGTSAAGDKPTTVADVPPAQT